MQTVAATTISQSSLFSIADIPLPPKSESTLASTAMLSKLTIRNWDGYKYDRQVSEEIAELHNAEKDAGRFRKRLLPRKALQPITQAIGNARRIHKFYTLPWGDDEYRILPSAAYFDHQKAMREAKGAFFSAIARFEKGFEHLVIHQHGLGSMFQVEDYPGMREENRTLVFRYPKELEEYFSFDTPIKPMTTEEDFRAAVGDQERERIRRQIAESVNAALRLGTREIWQRLYEPVSHMAKCMAEFSGAGKNNKPKLYESMMTNIVKVLDVLPKLNLERDGSLEKLAEEIRSDLIVERKELRKSEELSKHTATRAAEISRRMAAYMGLVPEPQAVVS